MRLIFIVVMSIIAAAVPAAAGGVLVERCAGYVGSGVHEACQQDWTIVDLKSDLIPVYQELCLPEGGDFSPLDNRGCA